MRKFLLFFVIITLFTACKSKKELSVTPQIEQKKIAVSINSYHVPSLLPLDYPVSDKDDPTLAITSNWFELYEKNGKYFLEKANYIISRKYDEITGLPLKTLKGAYNTLIFIDSEDLQEGEIACISDTVQSIWPQDSICFFFNEEKYTLRAEGSILSTWKANKSANKAKLKIWHELSDYKLFYKKENKKEELILYEPVFNDCFMRLVFVGDIDMDRQPDFIFEVPRDFNETRVVLYLSADKGDGKILHKASETIVQSS